MNASADPANPDETGSGVPHATGPHHRRSGSAPARSSDQPRTEPGSGSDRLSLAFLLAAGDLPPTTATSFLDSIGEPGVIDKRVILQTEWWVDIRAVRHRLEEMSPDYRANVLAHLEQEASVWVHQALTWVLFDAITGGTEAAEANDRLDLLDLLMPGWTHHTPLGLRLHELNGTTPGSLPPPPHLTGATDSDTPDQLRHQDGGCWQVTTESTTEYLLDLDRRRIIRRPGYPPGPTTTAFGSNGNTPARPPVNQLDHDREWTPLTGLVQCRLGRSLVALEQRPVGDGYRISTLVTGIQRFDHGDHIDDAGDATA